MALFATRSVVHYRERAEDFLRSAQLLTREPPYRQGGSLLSVHAAISFVDAVLMMAQGERSRAEALLDAERLSHWIYKTFPELGRGGE